MSHVSLPKAVLHTQKGISLIEVLVSLLVLAIGILGATQLQTSSVKNAATSMTRSQAAFLSYEIIDRMRGNPAELYSTDIGDLDEAPNCFANECTTAELAVFDLTEWKCQFSKFKAHENCEFFIGLSDSTVSLRSAHIDGDGSVSCSRVNNETQCRVTIEWNESKDNGASYQSEDYSIFVVL